MSTISFKPIVPRHNILSAHLSQLKRGFGAFGVKTSFEDEGASVNNMHLLRNLTTKNKMKLITKIGGAEAKTDLKMAKNVIVDGVVGPMIESRFAFDKYVQTIKNSGLSTHGINIESKQAVQNIDDILGSENIDAIDYVCIGRTDMASSYNLTRNDINGDKICKIITSVAEKIKSKNLKVYMGGSVDVQSLEFVKQMYKNELIDCIETRYVMFMLDEYLLNNFTQAFTIANKFEQEYMRHLADQHAEEAEAYMSRVELVKKRV
jgi:4-hydroxy-2-oxoheptanedioate aldolase